MPNEIISRVHTLARHAHVAHGLTIADCYANDENEEIDNDSYHPDNNNPDDNDNNNLIYDDNIMEIDNEINNNAHNTNPAHLDPHVPAGVRVAKQ